MNKILYFIHIGIMAACMAALALPPTPASAAPTRRPSIAMFAVAGCVDEAHAQTLREMGTVTTYPPVDEKKAMEGLKGMEIAIANPYTLPMTGSVLESTDRLKLLVLTVTGVDRVDLVTAARKGIRVTSMTDYSTESVAEDTIALMLAIVRHIPQSDAAVRHGQFMTAPADEKYVASELAGKTLGIVGLGRIGTRAAEIARGFGMNVIAWDRNSKHVDGVTQVSLEQLLSQSDVVSLHLALNDETAGILSKARLQLLKPTAVLVNTARAELVDERALYAALQAGKIAGAALDVVTDMTAANPLLTLDNVVVSPHVAYHSRESRIRCADSVVESVRSYVDGARHNESQR